MELVHAPELRYGPEGSGRDAARCAGAAAPSGLVPAPVSLRGGGPGLRGDYHPGLLGVRRRSPGLVTNGVLGIGGRRTMRSFRRATKVSRCSPCVTVPSGWREPGCPVIKTTVMRNLRYGSAGGCMSAGKILCAASAGAAEKAAFSRCGHDMKLPASRLEKFRRTLSRERVSRSTGCSERTQGRRRHLPMAARSVMKSFLRVPITAAASSEPPLNPDRITGAILGGGRRVFKAPQANRSHMLKDTRRLMSSHEWSNSPPSV